MMPGRPFPYTRNSSCSGSAERRGEPSPSARPGRRCRGQPHAGGTGAFTGWQLRQSGSDCPRSPQLRREQSPADGAQPGPGREALFAAGRKERSGSARPGARVLPIVCPAPRPLPQLSREGQDSLLQDFPSLPRLNPERHRQVRVLWLFPRRQMSEQPPGLPNWSGSHAWLLTATQSAGSAAGGSQSSTEMSCPATGPGWPGRGR